MSVAETFKPRRPSPPPWFKCRACGKRPDAPMIEHSLWATVSEYYKQPLTNGHDFLCTSCIERALGRELEISDLLDCLGNEFVRLYASRRNRP